MADSAAVAQEATEESHSHKRDSFAALALGAIGVVFNDSLSYAFIDPHDIAVRRLLPAAGDAAPRGEEFLMRFVRSLLPPNLVYMMESGCSGGRGLRGGTLNPLPIQ